MQTLARPAKYVNCQVISKNENFTLFLFYKTYNGDLNSELTADYLLF